MMRPEHLPDFAEPPLEEVVLGVQFSAIPNFTSVDLKDVWELFSERFPIIQELPPLEPTFETFGGHDNQFDMPFHVSPNFARNRLWFISEKHGHLIQFQEDKFLLNWRRRADGEPYPRFEGVISDFEQYLESLQDLFSSKTGKLLEINQAEVSYYNIIPVNSYDETSDWINFLDLQQIPSVEGFQLGFNEVFKNKQGNSFARLNYQFASVVESNSNKKGLKLALTFRGEPAGAGITDSIDFIYQAREKIVTRFADITTSNAHHAWSRKK